MSESQSLHRDTVLVVDDTPDSLSFLIDTLDGEDITALVATDGESALALVDEITPDLILMDALMPGIDGFETCRRLKREKMLSHVPVIFMTGLSETEHVLHGLAAGGVDYVSKPIVVAELLARMRVHLANAKGAQASRIALDATGRFLLSTDRNGRLLWCTPRAEQLLRDVFVCAEPGLSRLPTALEMQLATLATHRGTAKLTHGSRRLEFAFISAAGIDECLFRLTESGSDSDDALRHQASLLHRQFTLTAREAEVLLWVSRGKSNRDMSEILGISHRTVNKHLEQVFEKLGVGNRASAAAKAVRVLSG